MRCANVKCPWPESFLGGMAHGFAGYGFYVQYHDACCPLMVDGTVCDDEHPEEMAETDYRATPEEIEANERAWAQWTEELRARRAT